MYWQTILVQIEELSPLQQKLSMSVFGQNQIQLATLVIISMEPIVLSAPGKENLVRNVVMQLMRYVISLWIIWEHYGQSLFDLFDLRQPELWKEYRVFLKEYYQLT